MTGDTIPQSDEVRTLKLSGHVGFDNLPNQLVNKAVSQGFQFNIMCVGETGVGKSTLLETLFNHKFTRQPSNHDLAITDLLETTSDLQEANVKLRLTMVETCGYGDQLNKESNVKPIVDYIERQFENYLQEELRIKRTPQNVRDSRIHVCLYFISPTGLSLKSLDVVSMKALQGKVNIIPIIAKSDTVTKEELADFKIRILNDIESNEIEIYKFPTDDEAVRELNDKMNQLVPFAVVGSTDEEEIDGKSVRVRKYPWGSIQVDNKSHCDFLALKDMVLQTNMEDLRERTNTVHYESYRRQRLLDMGFSDDDKTSLKEMFLNRKDSLCKEIQQTEDAMRQQFVHRVKEKEKELIEKENKMKSKLEDLMKNQALKQSQLDEARNDIKSKTDELNHRKLIAINQSTNLKKKK